ncbi:hypothetical protein SprV_0301233500 [Sparganum proliferum]
MQKLGCPERITHVVRQLHDGMTACVTDNGPVLGGVAVTTGVTQGCALAPTLFSLMFFALLMAAYRNEHPGIRIACKTDAHILNSRRRQASTHLSTTAVHGLLFVDDCELDTVADADTQRNMGLITSGCSS